MRRLLCLAVVCTLAASATTAAATDWYARGEFNGWSGTANQLADQGGGYYTGTVTGLTPGQGYEYKITVDDWSSNTPGSNGRVAADASGVISFNFWESTSWADGWQPATQMRVGYVDPNLFDWGVIGSFNGWSGDVLALTDQGGGLHTGTLALSAGSYDWKFRKQGDWGYNIGGDFGNSAGNNSLSVASDATYLFELDLPNGRWRVSEVAVPEPATFALVGLAVLGMLTTRPRG